MHRKKSPKRTEVLPKELVAGRAAVHERVGNDGGVVTNGVAHRILHTTHTYTKFWDKTT